MNEDFIYRMNLALEKGYNDAKKENMEFLEKVKNNKKYANLYIELVLAFIEQFDFNTGEFKTEKVNKDILKNFGYPKSIKAYISSEENNIATIAFDYYDGFECWLHADQPEFKNDESFDLNIVNDLLQNYDISVLEQHVNNGGMGYHEDCISFDASLLIEARKELLKEVQETYNELIMNLGINNNQKFSFNQDEITKKLGITKEEYYRPNQEVYEKAKNHISEVKLLSKINKIKD